MCGVCASTQGPPPPELNSTMETRPQGWPASFQTLHLHDEAAQHNGRRRDTTPDWKIRRLSGCAVLLYPPRRSAYSDVLGAVPGSAAAVTGGRYLTVERSGLLASPASILRVP